MQKSLMFVSLMIVMFMVSGCGGMFGDGRMDAWKTVRVSEETTKQDFLKTKQVELESDKEKVATQNPTLRVTTQDSAGRPVIVEMDMAPAIEAAVGKKSNNGTYGVEVVTTDMPEGEFAESVKATGHAVTEVANAPATLVGTSGYMMGKVLAAAGGGGVELTAEKIEIDDSFNRNENHATGDSNTANLIPPGSEEEGWE